jgi:LCP family protein required for cell wall assembly
MPWPEPVEPPVGVPRSRPDRAAPPHRRRRGPWIATAIAVPVLILVAMFVYALVQWNRIERVDTDAALTAGSGFTNYLIVGTDSREGVDPDLASAPSIGLGVEGSRTDTMVVLHIGDDGNRMMSLPRDLWLPIDGGNAAKLNSATVVGGAPALIRTVQRELGLPLQRYMEVDIAGFLQVVEAVGSITIDFPRPACDPKSGLMVRRRGAVELGPQRALAYVRSRTYTEFSADEVRRTLGANATCDQIIGSGLGSTDGTADIGRGDRQRRFLLAVFDEIGGTRNPVTLLQVLGGLSGGLRIDDEMGMFDALSLARKMRGADIESVELPVVAFDPGGTSALLPADDAGEVLDGFR